MRTGYRTVSTIAQTTRLPYPSVRMRITENAIEIGIASDNNSSTEYGWVDLTAPLDLLLSCFPHGGARLHHTSLLLPSSLLTDLAMTNILLTKYRNHTTHNRTDGATVSIHYRTYRLPFRSFKKVSFAKTVKQVSLVGSPTKSRRKLTKYGSYRTLLPIENCAKKSI